MLLFTYGTLMKNRAAAAMLAKSEFIGQAEISGYALYHLGAYPGIQPRTGAKVKGELYRLDQAALEQINRYEGGRFRLGRTSALCQGREYREVMVYEYARQIRGAKIVPYENQPWEAEK